jgi:tetratricopeptide (TPR) repeat protein
MTKNNIKIPPSQKNYNLSYGYGDDLGEVPEDKNSMIEYCQEVTRWIKLEMVKEKDQWDIVPLVSQLGQVAAFLKMLRSLVEALEYIDLALSLIEEHNLGSRQFVAQSLRRADILRYSREKDKAEASFNSIIEICKKEKEVSGYLDVAYQHMGKLYFDFGDYKQALHYFYKALDLRKLKKDQSLIESTEIAIEVTKKKLL